MMASIENLSPEILVKIFLRYIESEGHEAFLRNISPVCEQWYIHSSTISLWENVKTDSWNYLQHLAKRELLYHTKSLESYCYDNNFSDRNLSTVLQNIHDLKTLVLWDHGVGNHVIRLVTEHCPHLERLSLKILGPSNTTLHEWNQFLTVCGPTLKHLDLNFGCSEEEQQQQLLSKISSKCPLLETFSFFLSDAFPIFKLRSGCPNLRELEFDSCRLITDERNDSSLGYRFKYLKKFVAIQSDFSHVDIDTLLKDSIDLEHLVLRYNRNLAFGSILNIPSDKIRILDIDTKDPDENVKALGDAVWKWRLTLSVLDLRFWTCTRRNALITNVLERLLQDNPNPRLESLAIRGKIDRRFFGNFIKKCQHLIYLEINYKEYKGREEIERSFGISHEKRKH